MPIYQTSTFVQDAVGEHKGYDYSRVANPTRTALQICLASLEGAEHGVAFGSGIAATTTAMHLVNPGDRIVCVNDVYGGVYRMFSQVYTPKGYDFEFLPAEEINSNLRAHMDERTRLVWLESPTNPLLNVIDIRAAAEAAHGAGAVVVVDNTFASPYLQQPLALGADIVMHSTTKYLGGTRDVGRRLRRHRRPDDRRAPDFLQNVARRGSGPVRLLAGAARNQDARRPHATALRERATRRRRSSSRTSTSSASAIPACPTTRDTRSPRARCATSAG